MQFAAAVRSFYAKLNYEIEDIAVTHDFVLPMDITDDEKMVWKELVKEKGWKFDKKLREVFERYRNDDVFLFENAALNVVDKDVNLIAIKAQPKLKLHDKLRHELCEKVEEKTMIVPDKEVITMAPKRSKAAIAKS